MKQNYFEIYQLRFTEENRNLLFKPFNVIGVKGFRPEAYTKIYEEPLSPEELKKSNPAFRRNICTV